MDTARIIKEYQDIIDKQHKQILELIAIIKNNQETIKSYQDVCDERGKSIERLTKIAEDAIAMVKSYQEEDAPYTGELPDSYLYFDSRED